MDNKSLTKNEAILSKSSLQEEFNKTFPPFIIYLGTLIILLSFFKDIVRVGFNLDWLLIRISYLPFILIVWKFANKKLNKRFYEFPLWAAGLYITSFCTFFAFSTGGLKSDYIFGLIQFYFAIALMPVTAFTFYLTTFVSISMYIFFNLYQFGIYNLPDREISSTLLPLFVFSIVVYIINSKIRSTKLNFQNQLYFTIKQRDEVIKEQSKELAEIETKGALGTLAAQVAHDIRSPLATLTILTSHNYSIPEDSRILLRNVINRIRDIANDLVEKNRNITTNLDGYSTQLMAAVIYPLVSEKRVQYRSKTQILIEFEPCEENYAIFGKINLLEFKRMLSNLINNAVEALPEKGTVFIKLNQINQSIQLTISDNGKGIPQNIIDKLGNLGVSYNKLGGSGLGLFHAKNTMEKMNGKMELMSDLNKGTDVILTFPIASIPRWFSPKLEVQPETTIIILDDDIAMHQLWKERLEGLKLNIKIINFYNSEQFSQWCISNISISHLNLYLIDLEICGKAKEGFNIIEQYRIEKFSVLVTSHFEENEIHQHCEKIGIKMIPKDLAVFIPIEVENKFVLI